MVFLRFMTIGSDRKIHNGIFYFKIVLLFYFLVVWRKLLSIYITLSFSVN